MQERMNQIQNLFERCFCEALVFKRQEHGGAFFETEVINKDHKDWLVLAAGLDQKIASRFFSGNPGKIRRASIPIRYKNACEISFLFMMHPLTDSEPKTALLKLITPLSTDSDAPWVEIRQAYFKIDGIPNNEHRLFNLRWEWDTKESQSPPFEKWLTPWKNKLGYNPAHSPSHLHINCADNDVDELRDPRAGDTSHELRLAMGLHNPLALILSFAVWLRTLN